METRSQRGRAVQKQGSSSRTALYIGLGVGAVAIALVLLFTLLPSGASTGTAPSTGGTLAVNPTDLSTYPSKGQADAPITVIEYADYQCPGCAHFANQLQPSFEQKYIDTGKVRLIFHEYPLPQHNNAVPAAEAARCAGDQEAYWPMHKLLYANQEQWSRQLPPNQQFGIYAEQLGLDRAAFEQCLSDGKYRSTVEAAREQSQKAQIPATPTFVIDGQQYTGDQIDLAVEQALKAKGLS
ncbi:MAG TPA: DsbA family protein [Roseiflexaceae bacterium]|nr:DsbA family protein [Roseiflexaceae bacterium]